MTNTSKILSILLFSLLLYLGTALFLYTAQDNLLYFPSPPTTHTYQPIFIENEGWEIEVTVLTPRLSTDKALIYFGGNAESVSNNAPYFEKEFTEHAVYLVNYRGYGRSTGHPSEQGNYSDALKIFDTVRKNYPHISILGRSLGSGVATYLASKRDISRLVLITPYDSIESLAQDMFPLFPISLLLNQKYLSTQRVKDIKARCLALIAEHDEVIPFKNSIKLVNTFPKSQIISVIIKGTNHNSISDNSDYFDLLRKFID